MVPFKLLYFAFAAACLAYIMRRGGLPERLAGGTMLLGSIATHFVHSAHAARYHGWEPGIVTVDCTMLLIFLTLVVMADRFWPIWITGLHLLGFVGHLGMAADPTIAARAYYVMIAFGAYPMWLLVVWGAHRHRSRCVRYGADASWRPSFSP